MKYNHIFFHCVYPLRIVLLLFFLHECLSFASLSVVPHVSSIFLRSPSKVFLRVIFGLPCLIIIIIIDCSKKWMPKSLFLRFCDFFEDSINKKIIPYLQQILRKNIKIFYFRKLYIRNRNIGKRVSPPTIEGITRAKSLNSLVTASEDHKVSIHFIGSESTL